MLIIIKERVFVSRYTFFSHFRASTRHPSAIVFVTVVLVFSLSRPTHSDETKACKQATTSNRLRSTHDAHKQATPNSQAIHHPSQTPNKQTYQTCKALAHSSG
jgi:hypothetical protein